MHLVSTFQVPYLPSEILALKQMSMKCINFGKELECLLYAVLGGGWYFFRAVKDLNLSFGLCAHPCMSPVSMSYQFRRLAR